MRSRSVSGMEIYNIHINDMHKSNINGSASNENNIDKSDMRRRINRARRRKELRNHILLFLITLFMVSILTITFGSFLSKAKDASSEAPSYKYFKSVMIESGDTLFSIAQENVDSIKNIDSYMNEVIHMNSLQDSEIHAGQFIIVPYYSSEFK